MIKRIVFVASLFVAVTASADLNQTDLGGRLKGDEIKTMDMSLQMAYGTTKSAIYIKSLEACNSKSLKSVFKGRDLVDAIMIEVTPRSFEDAKSALNVSFVCQGQ